MGSDAPQSSPGPLVLRIKLRYPSVDSFVEKFAINTGRSGIFLATRGLQPVGTELRFELRLIDDQVVLAGVGRVAAVYEPRDDDPDAPYGMAIEFMRATRESRDLVLRMLEHRRQLGLGEPALPGPEERAAPAGEGGQGEAERAPAREVRRPRQLGAERPRMPRTSVLELVAQLEATPSGIADVVPTLEGLSDEPVDLSRALSRARAIAGDASEEDLAALALGTELPRSVAAPAAAPSAAEPPAPSRSTSTVASREASRSRLSVLTPRRSMESLLSPPPPQEAAPEASLEAAAQAAPEVVTTTEPPPAPEPPHRPSSPAMVARAPAASPSTASPVTPSSGMPALSPSLQHLPPPHRGAPSTLAATAAIRAEAARSHDAPPSPPAAPAVSSAPNAPVSPNASSPAGASPSHDDTSPDAEPEPRRRRVSRPERLTRPPGVFAKKSAERSPDPRVEAEPAPAQAAQAAAYTAGYALETIAEPAPASDPSLDVVIVDALDDHGGVQQTTVPAFERVLAELEDMSTGSMPLPATQAAPPRPSSSAPPVDPLDQLALDDLDDAEPSGGRGHLRHAPPWHATVDETMPTEPVDLEDTGFEILAETDLGPNEPHERTLDGHRAYETAIPRTRTVPPTGHDDGHHEPTTARSALAAAVSRPTWTRSKALDAAELTPPPTSEISPPTIPGRVPTKEIDLESALDALDIEAEAPVAPLLPREPEPATDPRANLGADGEEEFPIELEFDD